jgi:multidrug resistance efflux pump
MEQAKALLSTAATTYSDYSVVAPMDGLVGEINVEIGQMVSQATQSPCS